MSLSSRSSCEAYRRELPSCKSHGNPKLIGIHEYHLSCCFTCPQGSNPASAKFLDAFLLAHFLVRSSQAVLQWIQFKIFNLQIATCWIGVLDSTDVEPASALLSSPAAFSFPWGADPFTTSAHVQIWVFNNWLHQYGPSIRANSRVQNNKKDECKLFRQYVCKGTRIYKVWKATYSSRTCIELEDNCVRGVKWRSMIKHFTAVCYPRLHHITSTPSPS